MLEFLRDKEVTEQNPFKTAKIKKIHFLPFQNVKSTDYGGRILQIAELKDSDLFLIVDKNLNTMDVAREIKQETETKEIFTCKKCNVEFEGRGKFLTHTRSCK